MTWSPVGLSEEALKATIENAREVARGGLQKSSRLKAKETIRLCQNELRRIRMEE